MLRNTELPFLAGLLALGALTACGPAPVPVDDTARGPRGANGASAGPIPGGPIDASTLPEGHPPLTQEELDGGLGSGASLPSPEDVRFAGVVRLRGDLATREDGFLMISVKPEGIRMPSYSRKYALADAGPVDDAGERLLRFELDQRNMMGGLLPGELVLEARFDEDGYVETKDDTVIVTVPTTANDTSAEILMGE